MIWLGLIIILVCWLLTKPFYWWKRGVPSILPLPILGNCLPYLYQSSYQFYQGLYSSLPEAPYVGVHIFTRPALLLRDPKIILEVLEEKSSWFSSHGMSINRQRDPMGASLFHLEGSEWKSARTKLSPFFSPARVKGIVQTGRSSIDRLITLLDEAIQKSKDENAKELWQKAELPDGWAEVEAHSAAMFFSVDVTAAAIFGLKSDVFEVGEKSEFYKSATDLNTPASMMKALISMLSPTLFDLFQLNSFTSSANRFITQIVDTALKFRANNPDDANDFIGGMIKLINRDQGYDQKFVTSQGAVFWVGGVETTAATLSFALYELSLQQDLQQLCRSGLSSDEGKQLIRNVISETLRKYPVFGVITRSCTRSCTLSTGLQVEEGSLLLIPAFCLHNDPKIFQNPERFDPGREFVRGAYLPFGAGPRTCLGMRMGQAVLEDVLSTLLKNYRFWPGKNLQVPLELKPKTFFTAPKHGIWLRVERLEKENT